MMEIKTGKQIYSFFDSSMSPDSFSKPPIEFYQNQRWVSVDSLQELLNGFKEIIVANEFFGWKMSLLLKEALIQLNSDKGEK